MTAIRKFEHFTDNELVALLAALGGSVQDKGIRRDAQLLVTTQSLLLECSDENGVHRPTPRRTTA